MPILSSLVTLLVLLLGACRAPAGPSSAPDAPCLEYEVRVADPRAPLVEVRARWSGLAGQPDVLDLTMPEGYAFARLPEPLLDGAIEARDADGRVLALERVAPYRWKLVRAGATEVVLAWSVRLTQRDSPEVKQNRDGYEHPYLAADHGLLVPAAILLAPAIEGAAPTEEAAPIQGAAPSHEAAPSQRAPRCLVRFDLPAGWDVRTAWKPVGERAFEPESPKSMLSDLVAIGAWSCARVEAGGMAIDVAFAPGQPELERLALEPIRRIVAREVELFGVRPKDRYLFVFVMPEATQGRALAGSPKGNSMALMVAGDLGLPGLVAEIAHLVGHEFHHVWGQAAYEPADSLRFLEEGFTDWFAWIVALQLGLADEAKIEQVFASVIASYEKARAELAGARSLAEAGGPRFFEGRADYQLVYGGGFLLAALLDRELDRARVPGGLEEWLRRFKNDPRWKRASPQPSDADFLAAIERALPAGARERFDTLLGARAGFDPFAELAARGVAIERVPVQRSLRANFDGLRVRDLDRSGDGFAIGVRAGDEILSVDGHDVRTAGDVQRAIAAIQGDTIRLRLRRDGQELAIEATLPPATGVRIDVSPWRA